jgi:fibronectin type 3 domain-containing protein
MTVAAGDSVQVSVSFGAGSGTSQGVKTATLNVKTNDPDQQTIPLALRGLATAGTGGTNEPSLQRILDLYQIGVNTGDADPATADLFSGSVPLQTPNDELNVQQLLKVDPAQPVTVQPLAVFGSNKTKVATRFGWYDAGSRQARSELFSVDQLEAQSVSPTPIGTTSFDPGSKGFGLYSIWPPFNNHEIFSEDVFNTGETDPSLRHHVHFYPLKDASGNTVPNAVVAAFEEFFNDPNKASDSNDLVVVLRNVKVATAGPELGVENLDNGPYYDRLVFNRIQNPTTSLGTTAFHDLSTVRLWNTGTQSLHVSGLSVTGNFRIEPAVAVPFDIPVGATHDVQIRFTGTQAGGGLQTGALRVSTNDSDEPTFDVQLAGYWQSVPENQQEPSLQQLIQLLDYRTTIVNPGQLLSNGGRLEAVGEEVLSPYWVRSDNSKPVTVRQVAAYHTQAVSHSVKWFDKATGMVSGIIVQNFAADAQSVMPRGGSGSGAASGTFDGSPSLPFGFKVGDEWSDPTKNTIPSNQPNDQGHHVRFFPLRIRVPNSPDQTRIVRDAWIMMMDFSGINYDYNDNVYVISNMRPAPPPAPSGVVATTQPSGGFMLSWQRNADPLTRTYNVYRSLGPGGGFEKVNEAPVSDVQFLDTTAPPGATYYYKVTAMDDWGGETAKTSAPPIRADYTPPPPASGVIATPQTDGILLDWQPSVGADDLAGYRVYRSGSANGPFTQIPGVATDTIFNDTTASGGFVWYYNVVAVDNNGNESDPITASAVRPGGDPGAVLAGAPDVTTGGTTYTFVVTFSENAIMLPDALAGSVAVTGPGGFSQTAQAANVDGHNVTYAITPPGGSWNAADTGAYTIAMQGNKVGDGNGKFVPAGNLGTFQVNVPPAYEGETMANAIDLGTFAVRGKKAVRDALTPGGKTDLFYKITLGQVSRLRSKLVKLRDDVAFDLRDANNTTLVTSDRPKRRPESIRRPLPAGTYFLHLTLKGTVGTNYVMNTIVSKPSKKDLRTLNGS